MIGDFDLIYGNFEKLKKAIYGDKDNSKLQNKSLIDIYGGQGKVAYKYGYDNILQRYMYKFDEGFINRIEKIFSSATYINLYGESEEIFEGLLKDYYGEFPSYNEHDRYNATKNLVPDEKFKKEFTTSFEDFKTTSNYIVVPSDSNDNYYVTLKLSIPDYIEIGTENVESYSISSTDTNTYNDFEFFIIKARHRVVIYDKFGKLFSNFLTKEIIKNEQFVEYYKDKLEKGIIPKYLDIIKENSENKQLISRELFIRDLKIVNNKIVLSVTIMDVRYKEERDYSSKREVNKKLDSFLVDERYKNKDDVKNFLLEFLVTIDINGYITDIQFIQDYIAKNIKYIMFNDMQYFTYLNNKFSKDKILAEKSKIDQKDVSIALAKTGYPKPTFYFSDLIKYKQYITFTIVYEQKTFMGGTRTPVKTNKQVIENNDFSMYYYSFLKYDVINKQLSSVKEDENVLCNFICCIDENDKDKYKFCQDKKQITEPMIYTNNYFVIKMYDKLIIYDDYLNIVKTLDLNEDLAKEFNDGATGFRVNDNVFGIANKNTRIILLYNVVNSKMQLLETDKVEYADIYKATPVVYDDKYILLKKRDAIYYFQYNEDKKSLPNIMVGNKITKYTTSAFEKYLKIDYRNYNFSSSRNFIDNLNHYRKLHIFGDFCLSETVGSDVHYFFDCRRVCKYKNKFSELAIFEIKSKTKPVFKLGFNNYFFEQHEIKKVNIDTWIVKINGKSWIDTVITDVSFLKCDFSFDLETQVDIEEIKIFEYNLKPSSFHNLLYESLNIDKVYVSNRVENFFIENNERLFFNNVLYGELNIEIFNPYTKVYNKLLNDKDFKNKVDSLNMTLIEKIK